MSHILWVISYDSYTISVQSGYAADGRHRAFETPGVNLYMESDSGEGGTNTMASYGGGGQSLKKL